jgi:hypothetical protein
MSDRSLKRRAPSSAGEYAHTNKKGKTNAVEAAILVPAVANPVSASAHVDMTLTPATSENSVDITDLDSSSSSDDDDDDDEDTIEEKADETPKLSKGGKPLIGTLFEPFEYRIKLPPPNDAWGTVPYPDEKLGPLPHQGQPSARSSNAGTIPPLWEDRGQKYQVGRYIDKEDGEVIDQEDYLVTKLMNMRKTSRKDPTPRRLPVIYTYPNGKPKDWNNKQSIKCMNDRKRTAVERNACEPPWMDLEREYFAGLCIEYPNASIKEYAERLNWRFKGDFMSKTAFFEWCPTANRKLHEHHPGRTLESVVHEYRTYKHLYDQGIAPQPRREASDKRGLKKKDNKKVKTDLEKLIAKFGPPSGKARDEPEAKAARKARVTCRKMKSAPIILDSDNEAEYDEHWPEAAKEAEAPPQPKLSELEEEALELVGYYNPEEVSGTVPRIPWNHSSESSVSRSPQESSQRDSGSKSSSIPPQ